MARWTEADLSELGRLWGLFGGNVGYIAERMGRTPGSISGKSRVRRLHFHGHPGRPLEPDAPAAVQGRTVFPQSLRAPVAGVLKTGDNQRKLGDRVTKGAWRGMPIYSLTIEERATCPRSCQQWRSCYGNAMGRALRYRHGIDLENQLARELTALGRAHPAGFVVRLHILGDFYDEGYVRFWRRALKAVPALRVFGYTARQASDPIGKMVAQLRDEQWDRFAVRTSGAESGPRAVVVGAKHHAITDEQLWLDGAIVCPAQTGGTECCATCGLCWSPAARHRPIAFLQH